MTKLENAQRIALLKKQVTHALDIIDGALDRMEAEKVVYEDKDLRATQTLDTRNGRLVARWKWSLKP